MTFPIPGATTTVVETVTPQSRVSPTIIGMMGVQQVNADLSSANGNWPVAVGGQSVTAHSYAVPADRQGKRLFERDHTRAHGDLRTDA